MTRNDEIIVRSAQTMAAALTQLAEQMTMINDTLGAIERMLYESMPEPPVDDDE